MSTEAQKADGRALLAYGARLGRPYLALLAAALLLTLAYWLLGKLPSGIEHAQVGKQFERLFDLNAENNVPTWFASFLWSMAAVCSYRLSRQDLGRLGRIPNSVFWLSLAAIALLLSLDEIAQLHETVGDIADHQGMRLPIYSWLPFGVAFLGLVGLAFSRFVLSLPRDIAVGIVLAGVIFVTGAVGFETLGALVDEGVMAHFPVGLNWRKSIALEEFLEMSGVILLIAALDIHRRRSVSLP